MLAAPPLDFVVLVPVKPAVRAKSRLASLGDTARRALVRAFAHDTVAAALGTPGVAAVVVVTDDAPLAADLNQAGVEMLPDGVAHDLNASLVQAAAEAQRRWPRAGLAALCADLPSLSPTDLRSALDDATGHPSSFVADAAGEGTTMYAALTRETFRPRFGPGSRGAHLRQGAHEVVAREVTTLRRDVDTPADLVTALGLGVGRHTLEAVTRHSL